MKAISYLKYSYDVALYFFIGLAAAYVCMQVLTLSQANPPTVMELQVKQ